ncbi:hypothetical protein D3C73_1380420 [compost metagenome]
MRAKVRVAEFNRLFQRNADYTKNVVQVLLLAADKNMQDPLHFLHFTFCDLKLVDDAGRIRIFAVGACLNILLHKTPVQGIARMLSPEAVHL